MRSIVVVSDLTPNSDPAVRCAGGIAASAGATLHVLHATGLVGRPLREAVPLLSAQSTLRMETALGAQLRRAVPAAVSVRPHLSHHGTPEAARERVQSTGADLLVMASDSGPARGHAWSIREAVSAVGCPVLVARSGDPRYRRVVIPAARDELGSARLASTCGWFRHLFSGAARRAEIHVLHVCARLSEWREAAPALESEVRGLEDDGWGPGGIVHSHVRWSALPAPQIVAAASAEAADLIVLRPRSAPGSLGTSRHVAERAQCGVLLLPGSREPEAATMVEGAREAPGTSGWELAGDEEADGELAAERR